MTISNIGPQAASIYELSADQIDMVAGGASSLGAALGNLFGSIGTLLATPAVAAYNTVATTVDSLETGSSVVTAVQSGVSSGLTTANHTLALVPSGSAGLTKVASAIGTAIGGTLANILHGI
jgi:hypothetical protein